MAFVLKPSSHVGRDVERIAVERLDDAIHRLDQLAGCTGEQIEEHVHEIRKRSKELRGLVRLLRPALGKDFDQFNRRVRDAAAELSSIRDAHVVLTTLDHLRALPGSGADEAFDRVRADQAGRAAATAAGELRPGDDRLVRARRLLVQARGDVTRWELPSGFEALTDGLGDTYRRGRKAMVRARRAPNDERLHEWRKPVKHLWYQIRLLGPAAPSVLAPLAAALDDLADALGDDHDLAVLVEQLTTDADQDTAASSTAVIEAAQRQQADLRRRSFRLGATVFAESRRAFGDRIATYWRLTIDEGPEPEISDRDPP